MKISEDNLENSEGRASAELITQCAADITPRHIDFLWPGRLARGKHTAFAGEPGDGKSQLSIYVAATISRGSGWPCREGRAPLGNVIIFNAEDGVDDTIVPRLIAAGADRERVHIVNAVLQEDGKGRRTFSLQADLALLEEKIREIGDVALVIIDPISSYMGKIDSHKNSEVRGALDPLSEVAERMRVAVLSITHFSKAGSGNTNKALHRFIGSIAFVGAPRAAFAVIEDADNEGRILLLHAKNNMAPKPQGLAYRLLQTIIGDSIVASYVHWEDTPVAVSADQALGAAESAGSRTMKEEAADFLRGILGQGDVPAEEVRQAARKAGITPKPLRSAREALKVKSRREGFGPGAVWHWNLPDATGSGRPAQDEGCPAQDETAENAQPGAPLMPSAPIDAFTRVKASMDQEGIYGGEEGVGLPPEEGQHPHNPEVSGPRDCGPMPEFLQHARCPVCAVCKKSEPPPNRVAVDGLDVWLHRECEGKYIAGAADDSSPRPTPAAPAARTNGAQHQVATEKQPDAVADVPDPAEKAPPAADVIDEADQAKPEAVAETAQAPASVTDQPAEAADAQQIEAPPVSAAAPVPSVPIRPQGMLEGDWQRLKHRLQNQRETQRATDEAKARAGLH